MNKVYCYCYFPLTDQSCQPSCKNCDYNVLSYFLQKCFFLLFLFLPSFTLHPRFRLSSWQTPLLKIQYCRFFCVYYLDIFFFSQSKDKHFDRAAIIVCYSQSVNQQGLSITYKDDPLVLCDLGSLRASAKNGSLRLCAVPIVNTNNKTRNKTVWDLSCFVTSLFQFMFRTPESVKFARKKTYHRAVHHLLPSLILSLEGLVTLAANWTHGWCSLVS